MSKRTKPERLEMTPPGYFELVSLAFFGYLLVAIGLYFAIRYDTLVRIMITPISGILALGLLVYISYQIHIIRSGRINTIIFSSIGILIENQKFDILTTIPWEKVTNISLINKGEEKNPKQVQILSIDHVEVVSLDLYSSIFTPETELWENIKSFYQKYAKKDSILSESTYSINSQTN